MSGGDCCFLCNECPSTFACMDALAVHLAEHVLDKQAEEKCSMDDQTSLGNASPSSSAVPNSPADSAISMNAAGLFACRFCPREFETRDQMNVHLTHTHRDKPQYVCEVCDAVFAVKRELSTHLRLHSGEVPHACEQCGKHFGTRQLLKKHYMWHTGQRSHVCATCGKGFYQKGHLTQHLMIHQGRRPYGCTLCEKTFIFKFDLNRHMKIHKEREFFCGHCSKSFVKQAALDEHVCKKANRKRKTESPLRGEAVGVGTPPNSAVSLSPELKREHPPAAVGNSPLFNPEHVAQMAQAFVAQQQQQRLLAAVAQGLTPLQVSLLLQRQAAPQLPSAFTRFYANPPTVSPPTAEEPPTVLHQTKLASLEMPQAVVPNGRPMGGADDHYESATSSSCASSPRKVSPMNPLTGTPAEISAFGLVPTVSMLDGLKARLSALHPAGCAECVEMRSKCTSAEQELGQAREEIERLKSVLGRFASLPGAFFNLEATKFDPSM